MRDGPILYAEDDENDVFFMTAAFAKLVPQVQLVVVKNGKEAMEYLSSEGAATKLPSLLLLDLKMPVMSGLDVLGWIREQDRFASLPVAIFTSSTEPYDLEYCRTKGANAYLEKTSQLDQLLGMVQKLIACSRIATPAERLSLPENYLLKLL